MQIPMVGCPTCPRLPGLRGDRMIGRSDRKSLKNDELIVSVPIVRQKTGFRFPSHTDQSRFILHPGPVDARVNLLRQALF